MVAIPLMPNMSMPTQIPTMSLEDRLALRRVQGQMKPVDTKTPDDLTLEGRIKKLMLDQGIEGFDKAPPMSNIESIPITKPLSDKETIPITPEDRGIEGFDIAPPISDVESVPIEEARPEDQYSTMDSGEGSLDPQDYGSAEEFVKAKSTEKAFYKKYHSQHKDIGGKRAGTSEENKKSILSEGFKQRGFNVTTLPVNKGWKPTSGNEGIMDYTEKAYGNKKGDVVYLLPREAVEKTGNGYVHKKGWKPSTEEVVTIEYDSQSTYEAYKSQLTDIYNKAQGESKATKVLSEKVPGSYGLLLSPKTMGGKEGRATIQESKDSIDIIQIHKNDAPKGQMSKEIKILEERAAREGKEVRAIDVRGSIKYWEGMGYDIVPTNLENTPRELKIVDALKTTKQLTDIYNKAQDKNLTNKIARRK